MTSIQQNIKHLKDVLAKPESHPNEEALEFLEAIEEDVRDLQEEANVAKQELKNFEDEDEEQENKDFVGLDTIKWELVNGNLKVQMQMEKFIESLRQQNCV